MHSRLEQSRTWNCDEGMKWRRVEERDVNVIWWTHKRRSTGARNLASKQRNISTQTWRLKTFTVSGRKIVYYISKTVGRAENKHTSCDSRSWPLRVCVQNILHKGHGDYQTLLYTSFPLFPTESGCSRDAISATHAYLNRCNLSRSCAFERMYSRARALCSGSKTEIRQNTVYHLKVRQTKELMHLHIIISRGGL